MVGEDFAILVCSLFGGSKQFSYTVIVLVEGIGDVEKGEKEEENKTLH